MRFASCQLDYACFAGARLRRATFENCRLRDADFGGADLAGAAFVDCELVGVDFVGANLEGADVRTSTVRDVRLGAQEVRGLVVREDRGLSQGGPTAPGHGQGRRRRA